MYQYVFIAKFKELAVNLRENVFFVDNVRASNMNHSGRLERFQELPANSTVAEIFRH